ncbi:MAG: hypothetical protein QNJ41_07030 [Xenococcaceae cyanobacterium MO_188.B32]|nr:hypothetical protein [Xenococcaceae cyanobacterium MO_188.B32]
MTKFLLTFLASSASVVVLLVATNFPFLSSHLTTPFLFDRSVATVKSVNLNIANPVLGLTNSSFPIINPNFGCSCSLCIQFS